MPEQLYVPPPHGGDWRHALEGEMGLDPAANEIIGPVGPHGEPNGIVHHKGMIVAEWSDTARTRGSRRRFRAEAKDWACYCDSRSRHSRKKLFGICAGSKP